MAFSTSGRDSCLRFPPRMRSTHPASVRGIATILGDVFTAHSIRGGGVGPVPGGPEDRLASRRYGRLGDLLDRVGEHAGRPCRMVGTAMQVGHGPAPAGAYGDHEQWPDGRSVSRRDCGYRRCGVDALSRPHPCTVRGSPFGSLKRRPLRRERMEVILSLTVIVSNRGRRPTFITSVTRVANVSAWAARALQRYCTPTPRRCEARRKPRPQVHSRATGRLQTRRVVTHSLVRHGCWCGPHPPSP